MPSLSSVNGEPEPDVAVFEKRWEDYLDSPPASEARLFVEVTNTTQTEDRQIKRRMYARAGVPDYWILDVTRRTLTVHRQPLGDDYASITTLTEDQIISIFAATNGYLDDLPVENVRAFETGLLKYVHETYPDLPLGIANTKALSEDATTTLKSAIETFKAQFTRPAGGAVSFSKASASDR